MNGERERGEEEDQKRRYENREGRIEGVREYEGEKGEMREQDRHRNKKKWRELMYRERRMKGKRRRREKRNERSE